MNVLNFLVKLRERDIQVWADGDRLLCNAPAGALTPELRDELQRRKREIAEFLRSAEALAQQQRAIVPLQPRGTAAPIFAVAGHNGDVFCFRALARHLGADQPFFALQPPGLDGNREPLARVGELAAYFADQIRTVRPDGPYVVAGYCAGGSIAFELAHHLLRRGAEIQMLALFGSPFPASYRLVPQLRELLGRTVERAARHTRALAVLSAAELRAYMGERLRNLKAERAAGHPAAPDPVLIWRAKVERATLSAIRRYRPVPFPGRVSLFWPGQKCAGNALAQWPALAPRIEKHFGPADCNGANMLKEPHAAAFADLYRRCAAQASTMKKAALPKLPLPSAPARSRPRPPAPVRAPSSGPATA